VWRLVAKLFIYPGKRLQLDDVKSLRIPVATAAEFMVHGHATARDISYLVTVASLAADDTPIDEEGLTYRFSDNGLRHLLGRIRRSSIEVEDGRFDRLSQMTVTVPQSYDPVTAASVPYQRLSSGRVTPIRSTGKSGKLMWQVPRPLVDAFRPEGEETVELPMRLLQFARSQYTTIGMMRILAWLKGDVDRTWVHHRSADRLTLRIPIAEFYETMMLPSSMRPSRAVSDVAQVLAAEITELTDYVVEADGRMIRTKTSRRGRLRDIEILVATPAPVVEHSWRAPSRPSKSRPRLEPPAPSSMESVASIRAAPLLVTRARPTPGGAIGTPKKLEADESDVPF